MINLTRKKICVCLFVFTHQKKKKKSKLRQVDTHILFKCGRSVSSFYGLLTSLACASFVRFETFFTPFFYHGTF